MLIIFGMEKPVFPVQTQVPVEMRHGQVCFQSKKHFPAGLTARLLEVE